MSKNRLELSHLADVLKIESGEQQRLPNESAFLKSLFQTFLENREPRVTRLRVAVRSGSMCEVRSFSHELKSSCLAIGCERAAAISGKIERLAREDREIRSHRRQLINMWCNRLAAELSDLDVEVRQIFKLP